jgi:hypothetical protein
MTSTMLPSQPLPVQHQQPSYRGVELDSAIGLHDTMAEANVTLRTNQISESQSDSSPTPVNRGVSKANDDDGEQSIEDNSEYGNNKNLTEEKDEVHDSATRQYSSSHNDTLDGIWKFLEDNKTHNHHHNNNSNKNASFQVAIQQTMDLLSQHYQALMEPAQAAMMELEQIKVKLGTLQESHQAQEREIARYQLSEKQAQASIAVHSCTTFIAFCFVAFC